MAGASTEDKIDLNQQAVAGCRDGVTVYRITRFFGGSNEKGFTTEDTWDTEESAAFLCALRVLYG
jgi:hypothetical protein